MGDKNGPLTNLLVKVLPWIGGALIGYGFAGLVQEERDNPDERVMELVEIPNPNKSRRRARPQAPKMTP